mgnify:CR=1 FL=1
MFSSKGLIHLVGIVPIDNSEEIFKICGDYVGKYLISIPEGEIKYDENFSSSQKGNILISHPDLESLTISDPSFINNFCCHSLFSSKSFSTFKFKAGVKFIRLDNLSYFDDIIKSYRTFHKLRDIGVIPPDLRFQISLPTPLTAMGFLFRDADDFERMAASFIYSTANEIEKIFRFIPSRDLAIQWNIYFETLDINGLIKWSPNGNPWVRFSEQILPISMKIPNDALLGFHFCYGELNNLVESIPSFLSNIVSMANVVSLGSGRSIDWIHLPISLGKINDDYFNPLKELDKSIKRINLGLINVSEGIDSIMEKIELVKKVKIDFGVSTPCCISIKNSNDLITQLEMHKIIANYF